MSAVFSLMTFFAGEFEVTTMGKFLMSPGRLPGKSVEQLRGILRMLFFS
jgi:hypothetical protein